MSCPLWPASFGPLLYLRMRWTHWSQHSEASQLFLNIKCWIHLVDLESARFCIWDAIHIIAWCQSKAKPKQQTLKNPVSKRYCHYYMLLEYGGAYRIAYTTHESSNLSETWRKFQSAVELMFWGSLRDK